MTASIESPPSKGWVLNPLFDKLAALEKLKALALREHSHNEMDRFYTCPQHPDAWLECRGLPCDCGADAHNREVELVWAEILGVEVRNPPDSFVLCTPNSCSPEGDSGR